MEPNSVQVQPVDPVIQIPATITTEWLETKLAEAIKLRKEGKFDESFNLFVDLIKAGIEFHGKDELNPAMAKFYYEYGNTLLFKVEESTDVFGEDGPLKSAEGTAKKGEATNEDSKEEEDAGEGEVGEESVKAVVDLNQPSASKAAEAAPNAPVEEVDDLQLAWENIELARNISERVVTEIGAAGKGADKVALDSTYKNLVNIQIRLGDLQSWKENFRDALVEYQKALDYALFVFDKEYSRELAEMYIVA